MRARYTGLATVLMCLITSSWQRSFPEDDSYVAAVVEYGAVGNPASQSREELYAANLRNYRGLLERAVAEEADIVVFPECGLSTMDLPSDRHLLLRLLTLVPEPGVGPPPCDGGPPPLRNLSCLAREYAVYLVANLPEVAPCSPSDPRCPPDGVYIYNTNVAFDRAGHLVARYRKYNLFVEPGFDITPEAELSMFDTDFGVRFGMIICNDLLYAAPAVNLTAVRGITDFVYSTAWFNELPFLTATQFQAGWAYAMDVNFLAAGQNRPQVYNAGSGIYAGRNGSLVAQMPSNRTDQVLVHRVAKKPAKTPEANPPRDAPQRISASPPNGDVGVLELPFSQLGELKFFQDYLAPYSTVPVERSLNATVCNHDLCCAFDVELTSERRDAHFSYRLVVFDGVRAFAGQKTAGVNVCALVACRGTSLTTCGLYTNDTARFARVMVRGVFLQRDAVVTPSTLTTGVLPLTADQFKFTAEPVVGSGVAVTMETSQPLEGLLTFGVYARVYSRDGTRLTTA